MIPPDGAANAAIQPHRNSLDSSEEDNNHDQETDINAKDDQGLTELMTAERGSVEMVRLLDLFGNHH